MGIGTSKGAFYTDEAHYHASQWDDRYDDNVVSPQELGDRKKYAPPASKANLTVDGSNSRIEGKELFGGDAEREELDSFTPEELRNPDMPGRLYDAPPKNVAGNTKMPFPDNRDPRTDFDYRYPKDLPPSGILNDLKKPTGETRPLVRRISDHTGFEPSSNIEDRRNEPQPGFLESVTHHFGTQLFGSNYTPEIPLNKLAHELGATDIKIEKNVGPSLLEEISNDFAQATHTVKQIIDAIPYVKRGYGANYDTILTTAKEKEFADWKHKYAPKDSGEDYDLRGAFEARVEPDKETGHWPDTFKKPNHPTFSDQSKYAKDAPDLAGSWDGDTYIPPANK